MKRNVYLTLLAPEEARPRWFESLGAEAFALPRPVIVDVVVDREENVAPMVPAGKSITEMILV